MSQTANLHLNIMKAFLFLCTLFTAAISNAQIISGKIISEEKLPLGYARIGIINESFGTIADDKGIFSIDLTKISPEKKVTVQLVGFEPWTESVSDFTHQQNWTIILKEKKQNLEDVVVTSEKQYVQKNWGINKKGNSVSINIYGNSVQDSSKEFALEFDNKKRVKILKINLNIPNFQNSDTLLLDFDILSRDNKLPSQSLLYQSLRDTLTLPKIHDGTYSLDISGKNIWVNKKDFFVSVKILNRNGGQLNMNGALFHKFYYRNFFGEWKKLAIAAPSLNIDVKVEK